MKVELLSQVSSNGLGTSIGKSLSNLPDELLDGLEGMSLLPGALLAPSISIGLPIRTHNLSNNMLQAVVGGLSQINAFFVKLITLAKLITPAFHRNSAYIHSQYAFTQLQDENLNQQSGVWEHQHQPLPKRPRRYY
jgi:hypothetical protein